MGQINENIQLLIFILKMRTVFLRGFYIAFSLFFIDHFRFTDLFLFGRSLLRCLPNRF